MAITKVKADLIDLNEPNSTKGLKMPSGGAFSGTATEGMVRNDTSQSSLSSASTMQFYNGTEWKNFSNLYVPPVGTENFDPVIYSGNGGTQSITSVGFAPDLVWIKRRDNGIGSTNHLLFDSVRGAGKRVMPNLANAQSTETDELTSFDSNGFSVGADGSTNGSGASMVAWCWKAGGASVPNNEGDIQSDVSANVDAGFSIVDYTGVAGGVGLGGQTPVGHGLSAAPELVIYKAYTGSADDWYVMFKEGSQYKAMYLNYNFAGFNQTNDFTSTTIQTYRETNQNLVAYCFHSVDGYQKIGIYTGDGTTTNAINVGFEPRFVLIKSTSVADNWVIFDSGRDSSNPRDTNLKPNSSAAEANEPGAKLNFTSTGFTLIGSGAGIGQVNSNGATYLYLAIA